MSIAHCFVRHFQRRHPRELGAPEVEAFLAMLANERRVSASAHNPALSALLFLYRAGLEQVLPWLDSLQRPRRVQRLPVILTVGQVQAVLARMEGEHALLARLRYGTGMRLMEALWLRVKDVDFAHRTLIVREGKGNKDRTLMLPQALEDGLRAQLGCARSLRLRDRADHCPGVELPEALARKYPRAGEAWAWHRVFPQATLSRDPRSGERQPASPVRSDVPAGVRAGSSRRGPCRQGSAVGRADFQPGRAQAAAPRGAASAMVPIGRPAPDPRGPEKAGVGGPKVAGEAPQASPTPGEGKARPA